jgi:hypothetical protein
VPNRAVVAELCSRLFDDASMFPPETQSLRDASRAHVRHRLAWYGGMLGSLVCQAARLTALDHLAERDGVDHIEASVVVSRGLPSLPVTMATAEASAHVEVRAIELPLGAHPLGRALNLLSPWVSARRAVFLEISAPAVTESVVHEIAPSGVGLKLRAGGTSIDSFQPEAELARVIVLCAAERLAFTCSAGLHRALRHRDPDTLLDHHGYLNIALAARIAGATGSVRATQEVLADLNPASICYRVRDLEPADLGAIRALISSIATFNVAQSVNDLVDMGLITAQ